LESPIQVELEVKGVLTSQAMANSANEPAVLAACKVSAGAYRFSLPTPPVSGAPYSVYAVNPLPVPGQYTRTLIGSSTTP
jgi:hypothetical protein